jgi:hypothetical protein
MFKVVRAQRPDRQRTDERTDKQRQTSRDRQTDRQAETDRQTDMVKLIVAFSQFCECAWKHYRQSHKWATSILPRRQLYFSRLLVSAVLLPEFYKQVICSGRPVYSVLKDMFVKVLITFVRTAFCSVLIDSKSDLCYSRGKGKRPQLWPSHCCRKEYKAVLPWLNLDEKKIIFAVQSRGRLHLWHMLQKSWSTSSHRVSLFRHRIHPSSEFCVWIIRVLMLSSVFFYL